MDYSILGSILGSPYLGKLPFSLAHRIIPESWIGCRGVYYGSLRMEACKQGRILYKSPKRPRT